MYKEFDNLQAKAHGLRRATFAGTESLLDKKKCSCSLVVTQQRR